ncbi:MAG TPA: tripartite tricarboxylate transporter substrate binding protein [Ramlibacter sp.]|nr:tripartite tricarboxylate transporter substrate binding protein [Ramlibacter sp.]
MTTAIQPARFLLAAATLALAGAAAAQAPANWPDKPVRVIVPLPPGGPSDIVLRAAIDKMQPVLKQPLVVDNKPGAAGNVGAGEAARATPDGYTWLWSTDTLLTVNPHVYDKLTFKAADLQPVMRASSFSQTLVCNPALGVRTVSDLVRRAREKQLSYASGGAGSPGHLTTELFKSATGAQMLHIPYKGPAPAMQDVMAGQVDCGFLAGPTVLPHVRAGKLVALAVSGARRSPLLPEVPTVAEAGVANFDASFSLVLYAPRGMPAPVVQSMHAAMAAALKQPDVVEKLRASDQEVVAASPADTAARLNADSAKWGEVARKINLKLE